MTLALGGIAPVSVGATTAVDGGTGRLAGASGQLAVDGLANLATGAYSQSLAGSLTRD